MSVCVAVSGLPWMKALPRARSTLGVTGWAELSQPELISRRFLCHQDFPQTHCTRVCYK